mmetsp:Transcript_77603/g.154135  ORF Transcript_77603/g.154135 Transcript_77603/m.154135 type:complete len:323 (+) Transcript_77603:280-1248(+)
MEGCKASLVDACGPRGDDKCVALGRERLCDVSLDLVARRATLVEAIEQEQRAPRLHCLPQHAVQLGVALTVLEVEVGVHVVPRGCEWAPVCQQPALQVLDPDRDGNELGAALECEHHELAHQRRLARGRLGRQEHGRRRRDLTADAALLVQGAQPVAQAVGILERRRHPVRFQGRHRNRHGLLEDIEPLARERVQDVAVPCSQPLRPARPHRLEGDAWQLTRRVVPRVKVKSDFLSAHLRLELVPAGVVSATHLRIHPLDMTAAVDTSHRHHLAREVRAQPRAPRRLQRVSRHRVQVRRLHGADQRLERLRHPLLSRTPLVL